MLRHSLVALLLCLPLASAAAKEPAGSNDIPRGEGSCQVELRGDSHEVFTYLPKGYDRATSPLVLVFHGMGDTGEKYRGHAEPIGDRLHALIAAPRLGPKHYPLAEYQLGNLFNESGKVNPRKDWTWELVPPLADELRRRAGRSDQPLYLIGHSAGGQFLVRLAAFTSFSVMRIVAANPGTHIFPTREQRFPYGFGGLPDELSNDDALQRYLARPLTLFLGTADNVQDGVLNVSESAMKQGATRYERGQNVFAAGQKLAKARGWTFNWRLVEAPGVAHSASKMFAHPNCEQAMAAK